MLLPSHDDILHMAQSYTSRRTTFRLFAKFGGSGCEEEPSAEETEVGAAVHGALQELETCDLPFSLPTALCFGVQLWFFRTFGAERWFGR